MLTETERSALIDVIKNYGIFTPHEDLDLTGKVKHIRSGENAVIVPPCITYAFMPISGAYAKSTNLLLDSEAERYPRRGFAQLEVVLISSYAVSTQLQNSETVVHGRDIANHFSHQLLGLIWYYWPPLLTSYGAHGKWGSIRVVDETAMLKGSKVYKEAITLPLVTTTSWRFVPPTPDVSVPVTAVDVTLKSDGDEEANGLLLQVNKDDE